MADAVEGVERHWEGDAKLGQSDETGAEVERVDHVQVVRVTSW